MGTTLEMYEVNTQFVKAHGGDAQVVQITDPTELIQARHCNFNRGRTSGCARTTSILLVMCTRLVENIQDPELNNGAGTNGSLLRLL